MVRRINDSSSSRLLWTALLLAFCSIFARAQSAGSAQQRTATGAQFVIAPALAVPTAPTSVAVGDANGDGRPDLVITREGSGSVTVFLGDGKGGFDAGVEYPAGAMPGHVLLKDLSGHGRLSIVVTDAATGAINVLRGNGDGTFGKPETYAAIAHPIAIAAGDFGGNERVDLAVASATGIAVLANDGEGRYSAAANLPLSHPAAALATADLKGNGHHDLVVANADGTLSVLLNDGHGHFEGLSAAKIASGALTSIAAGDFRGEGRADLAVTVGKTNELIVLLGKGDGSFEPGSGTTVGNGPAAVLVADLKGDGGSDLITVNQAANTFSVLMGKGNGTFKSPVDFTAGNSPFAIAAADFNGDGHSDLAILNSGDKSISLPLGRGDGTFQAAPAYRSQLEQKAMAAGDLRGTGRSDLVVTNFCGNDPTCRSKGTADVLFANADGTYQHSETYTLGNGPVAVALADLNGDKKLDLIAINQIDKTLMVMPGIGKGKFGEPQTYSLTASPRALYVGDFNGDGHPDVAIATDCGRKTCPEAGNVDIWLGSGDGKLALAQSYIAGYSPDSIAGGDLRGTGHLDLLVANRCGDSSSCQAKGTASLLKGDGKGRFADGGEIELGDAPSAIALASLAGKGLDLIVAEGGTNIVGVLQGDGKGGFGGLRRYLVGEEPAALAIADFNGDGWPDVAVANFKSSTVNVLYGTAEGVLHRGATLPVGAGPEALAAVANGKGKPANLVTANGNSGATPMGTDITLLRVHADTSTPTTVTPVSAATSPDTVDDSEVLSAKVNGTAGTAPTGTVAFTSAITPTTDIVCSESTDDPKDNVVPFSSSDAAAGTATATCTTTNLEGGSDTITATYSGDATYTGSSGDTPLTINATDTTTTVSTPSTQADDTLDLVVTAAAAPTNPPANPAGTVPIGGVGAFSIDGSSFAPCSSQGMTFDSTTGTASAKCTIPAGTLSDGLHFLSTSFSSSSSSNYAGSSGFAFISVGGTSQTVIKFLGTLTVDAASASKVQIQATVSKLVGGTGTPSGTVTFSGTAPGCGSPEVEVTLSSGVATCTPTVSSLGAGSYSVTATYNPDSASTYFTSNSGAQNLSIGQVTPTTTSTATTATIDVPYTLSATVNPPSGTAPASEVPIGGTITFKNGAASIAGCSSAIPVSYDITTGTAIATCTPTITSPDNLPATPSSPATPDTITATYSGDTNYLAGTADQFSLTINQQSTTATLSPSANPSSVGQQVTFTVTVAPPAGVPASVQPSGSVTFTYNSGTAIPGCTSAVTLSFNASTGYTAQCTPSSSFFASVGSDTISAAYSGDTNYKGSTSNSVTENVVANLTVTTLGVPPSSTYSGASTVNQAVVLTDTITPSGSVAPTGNATFTSNGNPIIAPGCGTLGVVSVSKNGSGNYTAVCTTAGLPLGTNNVVATYSGDKNYGSGVATGTQSVSPVASTVVAITPMAPASVAVNSAISLVATVSWGGPSGSVATPVPAGGVPTLGTVAFNDTTTSSAVPGCASVSLTGSATGQGVTYPSGVATAVCNSIGLTGGPHSITATFTPANSSYSGSTSPAVTQTMTAEATKIKSVTSSPNPAAVNQLVTYTANVETSPSDALPPAGGVQLTGGTVKFTAVKAGSTTAISVCSATLAVSGTAFCTSSSLAAGTYTITATLAGSTNFATSSGTESQTVGQSFTTTKFVSPPASSTVDKTITLTAKVTPAFQSTETLSGDFDFEFNGQPVAGVGGPCSDVKVTPSTGEATCTASTLPAGDDTITATYINDPNFGGSSSSTTVTVNTATFSDVTLASSNTTIYAGGPVIFTVTAHPPAGFASISTLPVPVDGAVTFFVNNAPISSACTNVPLTNKSGGVATCTTTTLPSGTPVISAAYSNVSNSNYQVATGVDPCTKESSEEPFEICSQVVKDFSLIVSANPPVVITQGSTTANDPIAPNAVTATPITTEGFSEPLTISCTFTGVATPKGATLPVCRFPGSTGSTLQVHSSGAQQSLAIVIDATKASPGTYNVVINGKAEVQDTKESKARALSHQAINGLTVYVSSSVNVGSIVTGRSVDATVDFVLPAGVSLKSLAGDNGCVDIYGSSLQTPEPPSKLGIACSASRSSIPPAKSAQVAPLTIHISTSSTPPGSYDILIEGTGNDTVHYEAVIKLIVTL